MPPYRITLSALLATLLLTPLTIHAASAPEGSPSVEDELRLMQERMAALEDRLAATSEELRSARDTLDRQQALLSEAGLGDEDDRAIRSGIGAFVEAVEISGVAAASFNYRFIDAGDNDGLGVAGSNGGATNDSFFRHPNANSFQVDQIWIRLDKSPTEESRAGFHADLVWGETAEVQGGDRESGLLYTGYVSYLAPVGQGVQIDAGKLATPLGAETIKADENFNITQGALFGLRPVTHVGVVASTELADGVTATAGVVNEVYRDTNVSVDRDKAYYAQLAIAGDLLGFNLGAIVGEDPTSARCDTSQTDCNTAVFDAVLTASPSENLETWINFDWVRIFGSDAKDADKMGVAGAARLAISDSTGIAGRIEYVFEEATSLSAGTPDDAELLTLTATVDHELAEELVLRGELRYDRELEDDARRFSSGDADQLVGLVEMFYGF
jgi:hypothetical protein